ncbi:MAG TPA: DMT family transporter, partial [Oligoflexia bacterium]|nr:DMT family transporter [Oligoflexia bacterium]
MSAAKVQTGDVVRWWGPLSVALGAGLWGLESLFRVRLGEHFPADLLVFYEHVMGTVVLAPVLWFARKQVAQLTKKAVGWLLISGVVGSAFGTVLFTASLKHLNVSVATVLLNLQPLVAISMASILLKERMAKGFAWWAALAVAAGVVITFEHVENFRVENPVGILCVFGAILCWGTATVAGRGLMRETSIWVAAPLRFAVGMLATLGVVVFGG